MNRWKRRFGRAVVALMASALIVGMGCDGGSSHDLLLIPEPPGPLPAPPPVSLPTPTLLSPPDGSVFQHPHPRTVTLTWSVVPGATRYHVDLEVCQNPSCAATREADFFPWNPPLHDLTSTEVTLNFGGAQPGRWRVWATGESTTSAKSEWWEFRFTV